MRPVDADKEATLERASSRGKKKRTLAQAQAEEAPAEGGREREMHRLREDYEVAAQRLLDVTNEFAIRTSLPPYIRPHSLTTRPGRHRRHRDYTSTVALSYATHFESATYTPSSRGVRGVNEGPGMSRA